MSAFSLTTSDGVRIVGVHLAGGDPGDPLALAIVLAHGFTGHHSTEPVQAISEGLRPYAGVFAMTFRGHGKSGGQSTFGLGEVEDLTAVITHARAIGYRKVVTMGWSMGASNVVLHGAAVPDGLAAADAVISVSGASRWFVRDTVPMRRVQWLIGGRSGRAVARIVLKTRIMAHGWGKDHQNAPPQPWEAIERISPRPVLVIHGDRDSYFGTEHPHVLFDAAAEPKDLWLIEGFGHAESGADADLVARIGARARVMVGLDPVGERGTIQS